jgi:hypothetical protein
MFALFFCSDDGSRNYIGAVDDIAHAKAMAKLLSKTDPRQVLVIENSAVGETVLRAAFRHGSEIDAAPLTPAADYPHPSEIPGEIPNAGVQGPAVP